MKNKGLIASVAVILLFLGATFVYQLGMRSGTNQASETSEPVEKAEKTVGILQFVSHEALDAITEGIKEGLKESGYTEGDNLTIEFQNGQADQSKLATMSQQLLNKDADVLVGVATPAAQALANVTQDVPIVLGAVTDPVGANLVADMDQPGGNITGVSDKAPVAAQIKLAKDLLPEAKTVGILYSSTEDNSKYQVAEAEAAAKSDKESAKKAKEAAKSAKKKNKRAIRAAAKDNEYFGDAGKAATIDAELDLLIESFDDLKLGEVAGKLKEANAEDAKKVLIEVATEQVAAGKVSSVSYFK